MHKKTNFSGSDPARRIFSRALNGCLNQGTRKNDPSVFSSGVGHGDSQQMPVFGLNGCLNQSAGKGDPSILSSEYRRGDSLQISVFASSGSKETLRSDPVYSSNGLRYDNSVQESILGPIHSVSSVWNVGKMSEVSNNNESCELEDQSMLPTDYSNAGTSDLSTWSKQKGNINITSHSSLNYSNVVSMEECSTPNSEYIPPKRKVKSAISIIQDHLSGDGDSVSSKPSLKRSSEVLNGSAGTEYHRTYNRSIFDTFMSERRSDTALLRSEPNERLLQSEPNERLSQSEPNERLFQSESGEWLRSELSVTFSQSEPNVRLVQSEPSMRLLQSKSDEKLQLNLGEMSMTHHSTPNYIPLNSNRNLDLRSRSCESSTPNSRFRERKNDWRHRRSLTYPNNKRSSADVTPYTPMSRSSESKRMRTSSYIPPYEMIEISLKFKVGVIDTHCHLDFLFTRENYNSSYSNYRSEHTETYPGCYEGCITVFCEPQNFSMKPLWDSILREDGVWAAFGCHPHMASRYDDAAEDALIEAMEDPKVIAFGEIGLDYSRRNNCDRDLQKRILRRQLGIALHHKRPLVIHCREAHDDCMEIMKELVPKDHFIHLHCFTDTWERAEEWLKEFPNLYIGITNLVTFPTAEEVHEIARKIPVDRLLLETDTPYFVPRLLTMTRRWSHPGMVAHVAAQIAAMRSEVPLETLLRTVRDNTYRVYGI